MCTRITLDIANSMNLIAKKCFPNAIKVIQRLYEQKQTYDTLHEKEKTQMDAINKETNDTQNAILDKIEYH